MKVLLIFAVFAFQIHWICSTSQDALLANKSNCPELNPKLSLKQCNESDSTMKCANVTDCDEDSYCCFDGCQDVCTRNVTGPGEIDWEVEPSFDDIQSDSSATRKGPLSNRAENHPVVICTTTFAHPPSLAIGCNAGYSCKPDVTTDADGREVLAKKGICVLEDTTNSTKSKAMEVTTKTYFREERTTGTAMLEERTGEKTVFLPGGCFLTKEEYSNIEELKHKTYVINCTCIAGSVECQFNNEDPNTE